MAARKQELVGVYLGEKTRFADSGTAVLLVQQPGTGDLFNPGKQLEVKIKVEPGELDPQLSYRFYGSWGSYFSRSSRKEVEQFIAETYTVAAPHGQAGIVKYLTKAPHIGYQRAQKLYAAFQARAVEVLRTEPERARQAADPAFTAEQAAEASAYLVSQQGMEHCEIDLMSVLDGKGFPRNVPKKAVKKWGNRAAEVIRASPYKLMTFRGCGFLRTDAMYLELGGKPDRLSRQALAAWYGLARDNEGHTWFPADKAVESIRGLVGMGARYDPRRALLLAKRTGMIATYWDDQQQLWIAEAKNSNIEDGVAKIVADMMERPPLWPSVDDLDISDHQREKLRLALANRIGILGGSPGTGKTYTLARLIKAVMELHGDDSIAVCAPTGKASVRITEVMTGYQVDVVARTIHGTLGVANADEDEGWGFAHTAKDPLPFDFIFIDESSMIDTSLMYSLLSATKPGCHVLLVGDVNQLLPVGRGAPLRDFITAGIPAGLLSEIRRNSGRIVLACAEIRDHGRFTPSPILDPENGENLFNIPAGSPEQQAEKICQTLLNLGASGMADPVWDCQVIVAVNKGNEIARRELNRRLQSALNPNGKTSGSNPFRTDDKIVCLKNAMLHKCDREGNTILEYNPETGIDEPVQVRVANGELGRVLSVQDKLTICEFDQGRLVKIPRGASRETDDDTEDEDEKTTTGCNFDLGYAISCHKSQGSEWKFVLIALDESGAARRVCSREWIYTAISRAKFLCLLVGKLSVAQNMCIRRAIMRRKTFMSERIIKHRLIRKEENERIAGELRRRAVPADSPDGTQANQEACQPAANTQ